MFHSCFCYFLYYPLPQKTNNPAASLTQKAASVFSSITSIVEIMIYSQFFVGRNKNLMTQQQRPRGRYYTRHNSNSQNEGTSLLTCELKSEVCHLSKILYVSYLYSNIFKLYNSVVLWNMAQPIAWVVGRDHPFVWPMFEKPICKIGSCKKWCSLEQI